MRCIAIQILILACVVLQKDLDIITRNKQVSAASYNNTRSSRVEKKEAFIRPLPLSHEALTMARKARLSTHQRQAHLLHESLENRYLMAADLSNGDFSEGLTDWIVQATETAQVEVVNVDDPRVLLTPTDTGTAEIIQQVSVTPGTAYRLSFTIKSTSDSYAYAGVRGHAGKWSELSTGENKAGRYTLEFETSSDVSEVTIFAQAYRQQTAPVSIDDIQLALADSPPVSPEPEPPTETPIEPPQDQPIEPPTETPPPSVVDSLLENGDFESDLSGWSDISTAGGKAEIIPGAVGSALQLSPSAEGTAALLQQVAVDPSTSYRLSFSLTSVGGSYGYAGVRGHAGKWSEISVGDNVSGRQTLDFVTNADVTEVSVFLQAYRQQTVPIVIDDIRLEANNGTPAPEPITPPPADTTPPDETPTDPAPPEELPPRVGDNLVRNADFSTEDLSGWQSSGPTGAATLSDGVLKLAATQDNTIRVEQMITGLRPETRYSFSVKLRSLEGAWASFGVDAGTQYAKTNSAAGDAWQEKRFTFYTAANSTQVRLFLESYMGQPGPVFFDDVKIVEGKLTPVTPPDEGWFTLPAPRALVNAGEEMLLNSNFEDGLTGWVRDHAEIANNTVTLTPTSDESARLVQDIPFALPPNTAYSLEAVVRGGGPGATLSVSGRDGLTASVQIEEGATRRVVLPFTTSSGYETIRVMLEQYKASPGILTIESVSLLAQGNEWIDTPNPIPTPTTEVLFDDFSGPLDPERWLIVDKAWGGDNGGLVPENVELADGKLLLRANGDDYTGDVVGHGDRTTRVGAGIATRDYYASGRYEVRARVPQVLGAASAFWTFHYIEYGPNDEGFWEEPSKIRNSEIDWEFPTALQTGSDNDPISYDYARVNSWGGKLGGEGAHHPGRVEIINDGEYHTYTIDWHAGGDGELPRVIWLIDGEEVYRHEGNEFGQDNIPYRASRFWLGIWFPAAGFKERIDGETVSRVGWAGDPNFNQATLEIDWVRVTPFNEANDRYEPETWPNGFYATPDEYPEL